MGACCKHVFLFKYCTLIVASFPGSLKAEQLFGNETILVVEKKMQKLERTQHRTDVRLISN